MLVVTVEFGESMLQTKYGPGQESAVHGNKLRVSP